MFVFADGGSRVLARHAALQGLGGLHVHQGAAQRARPEQLLPQQRRPGEFLL